MVSANTVSEILAVALVRDGRKHGDIAAAAGVHPVSLSHYHTGFRVPSDFTIIEALEQELKIEPGALRLAAAAELKARRALDKRRKPPEAA